MVLVRVLTQIQIIFTQHQLKQKCTTPHNLTKNISKLVAYSEILTDSEVIWNLILNYTGLVKTTTSDCLQPISVASGDLQVKSYIFQILQRFLQQLVSDSKIV